MQDTYVACLDCGEKLNRQEASESGWIPCGERVGLCLDCGPGQDPVMDFAIPAPSRGVLGGVPVGAPGYPVQREYVQHPCDACKILCWLGPKQKALLSQGFYFLCPGCCTAIGLRNIKNLEKIQENVKKRENS